MNLKNKLYIVGICLFLSNTKDVNSFNILFLFRELLKFRSSKTLMQLIGGRILMLSELEFLSWCEKNKFSKSTQDYINNNIRYTQPVRSVGSGRKSTPGKYPSKKMGVYIQWESKSVEGPAVLMMEHDEDVLEYYDQPNKIKLN